MSNVLIDGNTMTSIADAIRSKNNLEDLYLPSEMPEAIRNIKTESKSISASLKNYNIIYELNKANIQEVTE